MPAATPAATASTEGSPTSAESGDPSASAGEGQQVTGLDTPGTESGAGQAAGAPVAEGEFNTVTEQPAVFMNNLAADHGSWLGQNGSKGPTFFALTAWFRVPLMDDVANREFSMARPARCARTTA